MDLVKILPMAVVMVAGPQIISAILLATSERAKKDSSAFVLGAATATVLVTTIMYFITSALHTAATSSSKGGSDLFTQILLVLLVILGVRVYLRRKVTKPPKWMAKLQGARPRFAFQLGFLLFALMPTDLLTMFAVGGFLSSHGYPVTDAIPFVIVTTLFIGSPLIILLLLGKRADALLPKMRDWMHDHSWVVSEIVIVFFIAMEAKTLLSR